MHTIGTPLAYEYWNMTNYFFGTPNSSSKLFPTLNVVIIIPQLQIMTKNMFSSVYRASS